MKRSQRDEMREKLLLKRQGIQDAGGDSDADQGGGSDGRDEGDDDDLFGPDDGDARMDIG